MHNLTYQERARFADNDELRDVLETCAEQEAIIERLDNLTQDMLDVLYEVLPYIETVAEEDEGYKAGAVAKVLRNIQAVIKATEES
jgi:hypothetical protein